MNFCDILKELRLEKNLTQKQVADNCNITPTCICQLESGVRNPTGSTIASLAKFFECSADYLLGLSNDYGNIYIEKNAPQLTAEEQMIISDFRELSPNCKKLVKDTIKTLLTSSGTAQSNKNIS